MKMVKEDEEVKFTEEWIVDIKGNISCSFSNWQDLIRTEYRVTNLSLRGKSGNKFSLVSNRALYQDSLISLSVLDEEQSNSNNLVLYTDFSRYKPLMDLAISPGMKLASIIPMIRLVELALYLRKRYQLIGLFVNPCDLCL